MSHAPAHWLPAEQARRNALADADTTDRRRWRYPGHRTAWQAAAWLSARLEGRPGPFTPLAGHQIHRIETAAVQARERIEHALDLVRNVVVLDRPCPACRGTLVLQSGDGQPAVVECVRCGWKRTADEVTAA